LSLTRIFREGIFDRNPVALVGLGLCPALAVSTTLGRGLGLGVATALVVVGSSVLGAAVGKHLPEMARLPVVLALVAGLVAAVEAVMSASMPGLLADLGIFVPLVAANCLVLGRALHHAAAARPSAALADGLGAGLGFALVMIVVSAVREVLGSGTLWGLALFGPDRSPVPAMALAPGAFITLGLIAGVFKLTRRGN
jgi:electron transport complex protein RnfE